MGRQQLEMGGTIQVRQVEHRTHQDKMKEESQ